MPTLQDGRNAIAQGNLQQARLIYEAILQENPRSEEAWLGLADVLTDGEDKRICYENVLKINKNNPVAKEGLRNLEPQADPLVAALGATSPDDTYIGDEDEDDYDDLDDEDDEDEDPRPRGTEETPTAMLVAVGLALSLVLFVIGGGTVYFILDAIASSR